MSNFVAGLALKLSVDDQPLVFNGIDVDVRTSGETLARFLSEKDLSYRG